MSSFIVSTLWDQYRSCCVPKQAPSERQLQEVRNAFFAGAAQVYMVLCTANDIPGTLASLQAELGEFVREMRDEAELRAGGSS